MAQPPRDGVPDELAQRLRRLALLVRVLIVVGALLTVGCAAWVWVVPGHAHSQIKEAADVDIDQMALHTQVLGGLWTLLPVGIALLATVVSWNTPLAGFAASAYRRGFRLACALPVFWFSSAAMPAMLGVLAEVPPLSRYWKLPCTISQLPPCAATQVK